MTTGSGLLPCPTSRLSVASARNVTGLVASSTPLGLPGLVAHVFPAFEIGKCTDGMARHGSDG